MIRTSRKSSLAKAKNIGGEGIGIVTQDPIEVNESVDMFFDFKKFRIHLKGKVVWRKEESEGKYWVGINFSKPDFLAISRLVS